MTDFTTFDRDVNRAIRSWLHEDRHEDASRLAEAVLDQVDTIPQRRATWWPRWRTPIMNRIVTIGLAAAAVVVIATFVGARLFGSPTGRAGSESTSALPPTQSFTSELHGISVSYPEGWSAQAATEPWTDGTFLLSLGVQDLLFDPTLTNHLFLAFASQPIGDSTPEDWVAEQMASYAGCTATEPITVDGATGLIGAGESATGLIGAGECKVAVVTTAGRGYWIQLYTSGDEAWISVAYDRAWFQDFLATVQLQPEDAVD